MVLHACEGIRSRREEMDKNSNYSDGNKMLQGFNYDVIGENGVRGVRSGKKQLCFILSIVGQKMYLFVLFITGDNIAKENKSKCNM